MSAISEGKKKGVYLFVANYVIDENNKAYEDDDTARKFRIAAGNITLEDLGATNRKKDKEAKAYEKYIEKQKTDAFSLQNAGKSRRRHRRGRTLHKRRKSRKVRKTGCRRK